jgi:hypothetical protein
MMTGGLWLTRFCLDGLLSVTSGSNNITRRRFLGVTVIIMLLTLVGVFTPEATRRWLRRTQLRLGSPLKPHILSREAWGARAPDFKAENENGIAKSPFDDGWYRYPDDLATVYRTVAIHHSATLGNPDETMRDLQNLHMNRNRWADVGYHYGIDRAGLIYAGRDIGVRGSSVAGHNTGTIGIVLMGNFEEDRQPADLQLASLRALVAWLTATYPLTHLAAHGEFNPETVCPGKNLWMLLDEIALEAGLERGTAGYVPPA